MIKGFAHKGLQTFFETGSRAGIQPQHAAKLRRQLQVLERAQKPEHMDVPGWKLHSLKGELKGHWSVWVNGNYRMTFKFEGVNVILVDYRDYH